MNEKYVKLSDLYQLIEKDLTFEMLSKINEISVNNIKPVIYASWLNHGSSWLPTGECSNCHQRNIMNNFCPICGATMTDID